MVFISFLFSIIFLTAVIAGAAEEVIKLHGSTTVQKNIIEPGKDAFEKATGIKLEIIGIGTGAGLENLIKGACDASMASEELAEAVLSMKAASKLETIPDLKPNVITSESIKVIVHPSNPVTRLSKEQLKGLHTGKITNWKEVGGPDLPVIVVTSHIGSATRKVFQKTIMDGEPYVADALEVETTRNEVAYVAVFPDGIGAVSPGFMSLPENEGITVKVVETQEISRPLMLITKGEPSPSVKKLLDFFRGEGKKYIKE